MTSGQDGPVLVVWPCGRCLLRGSVLFAGIYKAAYVCPKMPQLKKYDTSIRLVRDTEQQ